MLSLSFFKDVLKEESIDIDDKELLKLREGLYVLAELLIDNFLNAKRKVEVKPWPITENKQKT